MDLTQGTLQEKNSRAKKMMLWFAMISMFMTFAGLASAVIVSKTRRDWVSEMEMPKALFWSTIVIFLSSFIIHAAKSSIEKGKNNLGSLLLWLTMLCGLLFVFLQFSGFSELISSGKNVTGPTSDVATSFLYIIVTLHLAHLFSGIIVLFVVIYNHYKQRYNNRQTLGLELGVMFWHFLDFLWVFLFLFFYFVR